MFSSICEIYGNNSQYGTFNLSRLWKTVKLEKEDFKMRDNELIDSHITNLYGLARLLCLDCTEKKAGVAICMCPIESDFCPYIKSLNFAIEFLERVKKNKLDNME